MIPRNLFRQAVLPDGPVLQPYSYSVPSPHRLFKNSSTEELMIESGGEVVTWTVLFLSKTWFQLHFRDGICKLLRCPGSDSKESIPQAYVAWRAGTTILFLLGFWPP
jgi:hypothetical protein